MVEGAVTLTDLKEGRDFVANGNRYHFEKGLTPERFIHFELFQDEFAGRGGIQALWKELTDVYNLLNKVELVKACVKLSDLLEGISSLTQQKHHPALRMSALFINRDGENLSYIDDQMINDKIEDWNKEGIDVNFFLGFAISSIPNYEEIYLQSSQSSSEKEKATSPEKESIGE